MSCLQKSNKHGFTLVELTIGLAISLILLGVAVSMLNLQRKSYSFQEQAAEMQQNIRAATDMMVREIRMAGYDPSGAGFTGIGTHTTELLQILADLDGNGTTTGLYEDITYHYYNAGETTYPRQIRRTTGGESQSFAENIDALTFSYYDDNGVATSTASGIRQIQITITGRTAKASPDFGYSYGTLTSLVTPVNLGY